MGSIHLDAPTFYVHWIDYPCLKGIFYETSEEVREYIKSQKATFERKERMGDKQKTPGAVYLKKMYSPLLEMKSFEAFVDELAGLLKK